jgi:hypothetical protein
MRLFDLDGCGEREKSIPGPRFKDRTWGNLRVSSDDDREELTYPGHPPPSASVQPVTERSLRGPPALVRLMTYSALRALPCY